MKDRIIREIDRYYFEDILPSMHPLLSELGGNKRLLYLNTEPEPLESLHHVFSEGYLLLPWQCADIITISDDDLITVSQAYAALLMAYLILDQMIDGQLPDSLRAAPLIYGHLMLHARAKFAEAFTPDAAFWSDFDKYSHQLFDGLAAESASLDHQLIPYTEEVMREVAHGKNSSLRLAVRAMAHLADDLEKGDLCEELIDTMFVGDQINDDTMDWREDFELGRLTYPILQAMQAEEMPLEDFESLSVERIDSILKEKHILAGLLKRARSVFNEGKDRLLAAGYEETRFVAVFEGRIAFTERIQRRQGTSELFGALAKKLKDRL